MSCATTPNCWPAVEACVTSTTSARDLAADRLNDYGVARQSLNRLPSRPLFEKTVQGSPLVLAQTESLLAKI